MGLIALECDEGDAAPTLKERAIRRNSAQKWARCGGST